MSKGWFLGLIGSSWKLPLVFILFYAYVLFMELRKTTPLTRVVIFEISVCVSGIFWATLTVSLNRIWLAIRTQTDVLWKQLDPIWKQLGAQAGIDTDIIALVTQLSDRVAAKPEPSADIQPSQREPTNPKPKRSGRLLAAIKALLGE